MKNKLFKIINGRRRNEIIMRFFRRKDGKAKLAELLISSGSLYKSGSDGVKKRHQSLDDIYGWTDHDSPGRNENSRVGLPSVKTRKAS